MFTIDTDFILLHERIKKLFFFDHKINWSFEKFHFSKNSKVFTCQLEKLVNSEDLPSKWRYRPSKRSLAKLTMLSKFDDELENVHTFFMAMNKEMVNFKINAHSKYQNERATFWRTIRCDCDEESSLKFLFFRDVSSNTKMLFLEIDVNELGRKNRSKNASEKWDKRNFFSSSLPKWK